MCQNSYRFENGGVSVGVRMLNMSVQNNKSMCSPACQTEDVVEQVPLREWWRQDGHASAEHGCWGLEIPIAESGPSCLPWQTLTWTPGALSPTAHAAAASKCPRHHLHNRKAFLERPASKTYGATTIDCCIICNVNTSASSAQHDFCWHLQTTT